ncbi:MAG: hypothetical protein NVS2B16_17070 [Chloroflexota bacterium]
MTNGCFDLIHIGHVRYLQTARSLGDALAVGLNSDRSVRALKGEARPYMPEDERAEIMAAFESVDFVTIFDEDTAAALVALVRPAIYVKGGDYSSDPTSAKYPVEGSVVESFGGQVTIVNYVPFRSTSGLVRAIRRASEN